VSDITDLLAARGLQVAEREEGYGYLEHIPYAVHPPAARGEVLEILRASVDEVEAGAWRELPGAAPAGAASALGPLDPDDPASYLRHAYRSDLATLRLARHFLQKEQDFDLVALYFRGLDSVEHFLWDALEPDFFPPDSPAARDPALADAIPAYYRMLDRMLGELRALLGPETVFIIVSDHGHRRVSPPGSDGRHRGTHALPPSPDGILIVSGPGLREERGVMVTEATLADVAPTALYLLGVPLARNLDGRILADVVGPDALARRPPRQVPAFARLPARETSAGPTPEVDREGLDRLRSLGYLR